MKEVNLFYIRKSAVTAAFLIFGLFASQFQGAGAANLPPAKAVAAAKSSKNKKMEKKSTFENPDFAFPETVEKEAAPKLKEALEKKDGVTALKAAMQLIVARNMVSNSSFNENIALLDTLGRELPQPYPALCRLLQANLYRETYMTDSWTYSRRTLPLDSYPEDVRSWSGDLFAKKVLELTREAVSGAGVAKDMPIQAISQLLTDTKDAELSGLSVYDFIVYNASSVLQGFGEDNGAVIPFRADGGKKALTVREMCSDARREFVDNLFDYREKSGNIPAFVVVICQKSDFLSGDEREAFLKKWCDKLLHNNDAGRLLHQYYSDISNKNLDSAPIRDIYAVMQQWLMQYPDSRFRTIVKYDIAEMQRKTASLSLPNMALTGEKIKGSIDFSNIVDAYVLLYKVPESIVPVNSLYMKKFPGSAQFVKAIKVTNAATIPFYAEKSFELPPLEAGYYVAVPSATPTLSSSWRKDLESSLVVINVSDISILVSKSTKDKEASRIYVVDARTQKPIAGAQVKLYTDDGKKVVKSLVTDASGAVTVPQGNYRIRASKGNNVKWQYSDFHVYNREERVVPFANILTDLSIYKPGDTVSFSLVGWTRDKHDNKLLKNKSLEVVLRDANWNPADTLTLTTDDWGRCNGSFKLPASGLLGSYSLQASFKDYPGVNAGSRYFEVAEYKAPGFIVEVDSDSESSYTVGDVIRFKGSVKTYSGMPLADADVSYRINWQPWWRWWTSGAGSASYGGTAKTDANGSFEIELPTENLKGTRYERGIYTLALSATSSSGETQSAPDVRFSLGKGLSVSPGIPGKIKVEGDSVTFNVPVYDMLDHPVVNDVDYTIYDEATDKKICDGVFKSPLLKIASASLPSSRYRLEFRLPGDTLKVDAVTALWREGDSKPPYPARLWLTEDRIICDGGEAEVAVGSGFANSWILCEVSDENGIISRKWYEADGCNIKIPVKAPVGNDRVWVTFSGMHNLEQATGIVTLIPREQTRKLEVKAEAFRDHISAGDKETWKFSFKVNDVLQAGIPAMAVMSNQSLNAIAPFRWDFTPGNGYWSNPSRLSYYGLRNSIAVASFTRMPKYPSCTSAIPEWNTYGFGIGSAYGLRYMTKGAGMRRIRGYANDEVEQVELIDESYDSAAMNNVVESVTLTSAVQAPKMEMKVAMDEENFCAEMVSEEEAAEPEPAEGGASAEEVRPRPVEMPLAFFMPNLMSDASGNVNVEFTTPNFNTTWQFQLTGYTEELLTAGILMNTVASKPVMVQSNLPRYLRTGDKASITALLFNNSDKELPLQGEIVVIDAATGSTIISKHFGEEETKPSQSRKVSVEFEVPSDLDAIIVKAFAYGNDFSDGEQDLIPVFPSSTPVVESEQFYIGNGEGIFEKKLPKYRKDANITLKYCDNPIWECVLALPSISVPDSKNIVSLMRALYANSLALNTAERYPDVKAGLAKALAAKSEGDTTVLRSNLEKDASLKTVALGNTPWVNNAKAETARMESLSTLLDTDAADKAISGIMTDVKGLQNTDGGWSWCPGMESSLFMTSSALLHFGMMKSIGCLPDNTSGLIKKALGYCDKEIYDDYVRSKEKFSTGDMLRYLYTRSFFDAGNGSAGFSRLKSKALKAIADEWETFGIYDKATAAILLHRSAGYEKVAPVILESLRQYASKDDSKGWWFDNLRSGSNGWNKLITTAQALEAYAEIQPLAPAVDGLRQWLVLQKETEDWGSNSYTVEVIQAILSCGSDWTAAGEAPEITLGGKPIDVSGSEMLTGMLTVSLDPDDVSGKKLVVKKGSSAPVWGGVISQYVAPISDVKRADCENLKVEKKILVVSDTEGGEKLTDAPLKVGDKVRVTITLTCDKDMNYVALIDERAACLEPDEQLSGYAFKDGLGVYREVRDSKTSFFIGFLPKGVNVISYDCHVDREGKYALGIASAQSQYSPSQTAHSAGSVITVSAK